MPYFNFSFGKQSEYVYTGDYGSTTDDIVLSQIDYIDSPSIQVGAKLRWEEKWLYAVLDLQDGISAKCGSLYDYDWLNREFDASNATLTNLSRSDSTLYRLFYADLSLGAKIPVSRFEICPYIGATGKYSKYSGTDGEYYYGTEDADGYYTSYDDEEADIGTFTGNVLALERRMLVTWAGIAVNYTPVQKISLHAEAAVSPYSLVYSYDTHYLRNLVFLDILSGYFTSYKASLSGLFRFNDLNSLEISWNFSTADSLKGYTYYTTLTGTKYSQTSGSYAGASYLYNSFYIGYRINI